MELDPAYCDVICSRFQRATGKRAVREDGEPFPEEPPETPEAMR